MSDEIANSPNEIERNSTGAVDASVDTGLVEPPYVQTVAKARVYRSKYADMTPEERVKKYAEKRNKWRLENQDRLDAYGREYCEYCQNEYSNIYKHRTTRKHLINADAVEQGRIGGPVKPTKRNIMKVVLNTRMDSVMI